MKRKLGSKPKAKEVAEVIVTGVAVGIIGFIIASMMSARFHSLENDPRFYEQKKTEMSGTQISQNN